MHPTGIGLYQRLAGLSIPLPVLSRRRPRAVAVRDLARSKALSREKHQEFGARRGGSADQAMAVVKGIPNRTANRELTMVHSRGGMTHSFLERCKTRKKSFITPPR
jgi:hypothetical protein